MAVVKALVDIGPEWSKGEERTVPDSRAALLVNSKWAEIVDPKKTTKES